MSFKFEKLLIWQKAMDLGEEINELTLTLPEREKFNLASQTLRAADSIALNISEGAIGQTDAEQRKFIGYSIRSLAEVVTCIYKAKRRKYINEEQFEGYYQSLFNLMNMLVAFRNKLK